MDLEEDCMLNIPPSSVMTNSLSGVYIKKAKKYRSYQPVSEGFHKQDSCKDAIQATSRVTQPEKKKYNLFTFCMNIIYKTKKELTNPDDWVCGGKGDTKAFSLVLAEIEENLKNNLSRPGTIVKQINRLDKPKGYGQNYPLDTNLPTNITKAIRDSGGGPDTFYKDITILFVPSDITDPASRTGYDGSMIVYPETPKSISFNNDFFTRLQGFTGAEKSVIKFFSAGFDDENRCTITFILEFIHNKTPYTKTFSTRVRANYDEDPSYEKRDHMNAFEFFNKKKMPPGTNVDHIQSGNPKKNDFFNAHRTKTNLPTDLSIIMRGIAYIVCKEFFGDILIALIAYHYKTCGGPGGGAGAGAGAGAANNENLSGGGGFIGGGGPANDYAVFTGDNALTAVCRNIKVNHVSTNHINKNDVSGDILLECTAVVYSDNEEYIKNETQKNKEKFKQEIIDFNKGINDNITTILGTQLYRYIYTGKSNIPFAKLTENIKTFLNLIHQEIIHINNEVNNLKVDDHDISFEKFQKINIYYKVKDIIVIEADGKIRFLRSVTNPFYFVPNNKTLIEKEFVKYLPIIDAVKISKMNFGKRIVSEGGSHGSSKKYKGKSSRKSSHGSRVVRMSSVMAHYDQPASCLMNEKSEEYLEKSEEYLEEFYKAPTKNLTDLIDEILKDPSTSTKDTILINIYSNNSSEYDTESIYSYLYFLFNINYKISYSKCILQILIEDIIAERLQFYTPNQWGFYYNYLITYSKRPQLIINGENNYFQAKTARNMATGANEKSKGMTMKAKAKDLLMIWRLYNTSISRKNMNKWVKRVSAKNDNNNMYQLALAATKVTDAAETAAAAAAIFSAPRNPHSTAHAPSSRSTSPAELLASSRAASGASARNDSGMQNGSDNHNNTTKIGIFTPSKSSKAPIPVRFGLFSDAAPAVAAPAVAAPAVAAPAVPDKGATQSIISGFSMAGSQSQGSQSLGYRWGGRRKTQRRKSRR